jgi:hypothetical protein
VVQASIFGNDGSVQRSPSYPRIVSKHLKHIFGIENGAFAAAEPNLIVLRP